MILDRSVALCAGNSGPNIFFPQLCNPCENQKAAKESAEQIQLHMHGRHAEDPGCEAAA